MGILDLTALKAIVLEILALDPTDEDTKNSSKLPTVASL